MSLLLCNMILDASIGRPDYYVFPTKREVVNIDLASVSIRMGTSTLFVYYSYTRYSHLNIFADIKIPATRMPSRTATSVKC